MANVIYTRALANGFNGTTDYDAAGTVLRFLLERSTSSYSPNKDHDFVSDLASLVEITVASYARVNAANKAVNIDDANDRVELDFDDLSFGNLESGQTAAALIAYVQTGGDDTTATDDPLVCRIDTATGLPAVLGGGAFTVVLDAQGFIQLAQA